MKRNELLDLRYWAASAAANIGLVLEQADKNQVVKTAVVPLCFGQAGLKSVMKSCDAELKRREKNKR